MKVCIPRNAAAPQARAHGLTVKRGEYAYDYAFLPKLALAKNVPEKDDFTNSYITERVTASAAIAQNKAFVQARATFDQLNDLGDFGDFFFAKGVPPPSLIPVWKSDDSFAEQRLSGANPLAIQRLRCGDKRIDVLKRITLDFDLHGAVEGGDLFVADYTGTDPSYRGPAMVQGGKSKDGQNKYLAKPLAFFRWDETSNKLVPVAIQLDASKDAVTYTPKDSRVYTPKELESNDWLFAKICVQSADSLHHEMSSHLARTHFVMEPMAVATRRCLADEHPLAVLLNTHFRFIIANDAVAHYTLVAPGGNVDDLLPGSLRESMGILTESYEKWNIKDFSFPRDLETRGVMNDLQHYPYRDDGILLWRATEKFVKAYLLEFYPDNNTMRDDKELQAWTKECGDHKAGARVKGMPAQFQTIDELADIITTVVFLSGPGHSSVNFAQYENMAFVANMPLALYQDVYLMQEQTTAVTTKQLLALLPSFQQCIGQLEVVFSLTAYKYDKYGHYDRTFKDLYDSTFDQVFAAEPGVVKAMACFQQELEEAEEIITTRNAERMFPYPFMLPSQCLNSISI